MTLQLIATLLKAAKADQERFFARQLPIGLFKDNVPQIRWLYAERLRLGEYPSRSAFKARFPAIQLPAAEGPLASNIDAVVDADVFEQLTTMVDRGREMHDSGRSLTDVVEFFRRASAEIRNYDSSFQDASLDSRRALKAYRDLVMRKNKGLVQPPSPWKTFNDLIGYQDSGELSILAARTSIGKTWLAIAWADFLVKHGHRVLFISKELPSQQIARRWIALSERLSYTRLKNGELTPQQLRRWARAVTAPSSPNVLISGHETVKGVGFGHIIQKVQEFAPTQLIVDGAYLIHPEEKFASDVQRFGFISSTLKRIAMSFKLNALAVVQVKREAEATSISGVTKAGLVHIYGSDTWAQDADNVLIVNGKRSSPCRTISLEKAREGAIGEWSANFKLDPYPNFDEVGYTTETTVKGNVEFEGV